ELALLAAERLLHAPRERRRPPGQELGRGPLRRGDGLRERSLAVARSRAAPRPAPRPPEREPRARRFRRRDEEVEHALARSREHEVRVAAGELGEQEAAL